MIPALFLLSARPHLVLDLKESEFLQTIKLKKKMKAAFIFTRIVDDVSGDFLRSDVSRNCNFFCSRWYLHAGKKQMPVNSFC